MARRTRSQSPFRRDHSRHELDDRQGRRGPDEPKRGYYPRKEENSEGRDGRNERYLRRRYEDDEDGYKRRSEPRERERSLDRDGRRRKDSRERERDYASDRAGGRRDHRDRDRDQVRNDDRDRQPEPSTSRRPSSRPRSRSRSISPSDDGDKEKEGDKGKPNFNQSGLLAAATNTVQLADGTSTVLKYNEPPEARKTPIGWRLYVFKGKEQTDLLHIHRQSCYLIGRDKNIVDIILDHPSCSKQHAVIQYRQVQEKDEFGSSKAVIKPFIIDLESTNSTFVNDEAIPPARYYELKMRDVIKFGMSTREYVLLHDEA